jgi:hypothetical protein
VPAGGAMHIALRYCAFQNLQGVRWGRLPNFPFSSEGHAGVAIGRNVWVSARASTAAAAAQALQRQQLQLKPSSGTLMNIHSPL